MGIECWCCGLVGVLGGYIMFLLFEFVLGSGLGCILGGLEGLLIFIVFEGLMLMFGLGMLDIFFGIFGKVRRLVLGDNFLGFLLDDFLDLLVGIVGLLMMGILK